MNVLVQNLYLETKLFSLCWGSDNFSFYKQLLLLWITYSFSWYRWGYVYITHKPTNHQYWYHPTKRDQDCWRGGGQDCWREGTRSGLLTRGGVIRIVDGRARDRDCWRGRGWGGDQDCWHGGGDRDCWRGGHFRRPPSSPMAIAGPVSTVQIIRNYRLPTCTVSVLSVSCHLSL